MNLIFKIFWVFCLMITILSICAAVSRFYQMGRMIMLFAGAITIWFLVSMLYNAIIVLFRGAQF
jgi:hypothetical protein